MPALLLPILAKVLPLVLGAIALVAVYFGIKRKGAADEREKQNERLASAQKTVNEAVGQDVAVDQSVKAKIDALKASQKVDAPPQPGDPFKF